MGHVMLNQVGSKHFGFLNRWAKRTIERRLTNLRRGELTIVDSTGISRWGKPNDLSATVFINQPRFFREAILGGTMGVGESYLRGDWDCDELTNLFRIFLRNRESLSGLNGRLAWLTGCTHRFRHWLRANTRVGSRRNIEAHYDLGNDFFRLWLDETMAYSSGIFPTPHSSLLEASEEKFDRICRNLELKPSDEVIEIGSGWGGFAIHAARKYGCRVTTTTISREQFSVASQRVAKAGLSGRVRILQQDYRDLQGQYDKLVSIEMIEAVGFRNLNSYFSKCSELLSPEGSMILQGIVMPERGYDRYLRSVDFLQKHVFPGGCLPSLGAMLNSVARASDLRFVNAEDFAPHYAETLRRWWSAFNSSKDKVRQLGYSEAFIRLWDYYLCYCEAAFEERYIGLLQIQFDKPLCRRKAFHQPPEPICQEPKICTQNLSKKIKHGITACSGN